MNSYSLYVALAVLVAVAFAEDARSKKEAIYNPYGPYVMDGNQYLAAGGYSNNNYYGQQPEQPSYHQPAAAVYPSSSYTGYQHPYPGYQHPYPGYQHPYPGYQQQPHLQRYNNNQQHYNPYGAQYVVGQPYDHQHHPYQNYQNGYQPASALGYPNQLSPAIRQAPVYPSPGAQPIHPPVSHPFYYGQPGSQYPHPIITTEANKPQQAATTDPKKTY